MKTIAIIDIYQGGHHLMYMRMFSKTLLELGYRAIAFYPDDGNVRDWVAVNCPDRRQNFQSFPVEKVDPIRLPIIGKLPQLFHVLKRWHYAATTIANAFSQLDYPPDLVLFNWIDDYLSYYLNYQIVDRIFPYPWAGLYFLPRLQFQPSEPKRWGLWDFHAILNSRRCLGVGVLDEGIAARLQPKIRHPVFSFPDLTDESLPDSNFSVVQQLRQQAQGRKIIGLLGSLNKRKGLLTLLKVAQESVKEDWFFAFIGQLSRYNLLPEEIVEIDRVVASAPTNCFFHFERIPDESRFNALVNECDVLFAAYEKFPYSSNLLTKAAVFNKLIIVSEGFCMGERVEKFRLGLTIPEGDATKCIEAIHKLSDLQLKPDFAGYRQLHSATQLSMVLGKMLENI